MVQNLSPSLEICIAFLGKRLLANVTFRSCIILELLLWSQLTGQILFDFLIEHDRIFSKLLYKVLSGIGSGVGSQLKLLLGVIGNDLVAIGNDIQSGLDLISQLVFGTWT